MRTFIFDFIKIGGDDVISILDLVKLCCYFKGNGVTDEVDDSMQINCKCTHTTNNNCLYNFIEMNTKAKPRSSILGSCDFGYECETLMLKYKALNVKPKYVTAKTEFTFIQYLKFVPYSCLIADLNFAFFGQIKAKLKQDADEWTNEALLDKSDDDIYPLSDWKMASIFDE